VEYFRKKVIVVIGATGVLGLTTVRTLRDAGADVRVIVRNADRLASDLATLPRAIANIDQREELKSAFHLVSRGELVDGIINCAGVVAFGNFADLSDDVARQLFATNSLGTINALTLANEGVAPEGFVASFTGVAGDMAIVGLGAYCSTKAAAKTAMAVAAREFRAKKIRVLDIRAPHTETGLVGRALAGVAPKMPTGLAPQMVVDRVLSALAVGEKDLPAEAFSSQ
jgi:cyclic-di-GMP-binding biofilm dispersal mediator protein